MGHMCVEVHAQRELHPDQHAGGDACAHGAGGGQGHQRQCGEQHGENPAGAVHAHGVLVRSRDPVRNHWARQVPAGHKRHWAHHIGAGRDLGRPLRCLPQGRRVGTRLRIAWGAWTESPLRGVVWPQVGWSVAAGASSPYARSPTSGESSVGVKPLCRLCSRRH